MVTMDTPWYYNSITIGTKNGEPLNVNVGDLYIAGMPKEDFINYMNSISFAEQTQLEVLREHAGERFTKLGISTTMATQALLNYGTIAYTEGCREEWAVYANSKATSNRNGCVLIGIIVIAILYFIFK